MKATTKISNILGVSKSEAVKTLSGFVKRTVKGVKILNVEDLKSLEKTLAALEVNE